VKDNVRAQQIYINGRFLGQPVAGVQRYAMEISSALRRLHPDRVTILAPRNAAAAGLQERLVGRGTGQAWEQFELPWYSRHGFLLNLGNTAPLCRSAQAVVLHDAGVFSTPEVYSKKFRLWYKTLQYWMTRRGVHIVTISQFSKSELIRNLGVSEGQISVIGAGADHMARIAAEPGIIAAKNLKPGGYVLAVGTLAAHKNLGALGDLAVRLAARGTPLAITGAFGSAAFQPGGLNSLPPDALYLGRVADGALKALYENAACFVFPSRYEGFGLPAVEAMACGCPVAAGDIAALRETCGDAALYVDWRSPSAIADAVMALLDDPARVAELRMAGTAQAARHSWDKSAMLLTDALFSAVGR